MICKRFEITIEVQGELETQFFVSYLNFLMFCMVGSQ